VNGQAEPCNCLLWYGLGEDGFWLMSCNCKVRRTGHGKAIVVGWMNEQVKMLRQMTFRSPFILVLVFGADSG
jgi:hypothetical protein